MADTCRYGVTQIPLDRALVVGVDAGGTTTRCAVVRVDGAVVGRGVAGGANQHSSAADPARSLTTALAQALAEVDRYAVIGGVFGIAGAGAAGRARATAMALTAWQSCGLLGTPTVVSDIVAAFAAGTDAHSGIVLIAGTGAVAAAVRDGTLVRRCDGYGWLLGDEGSAVWLGREAVRAALAAHDGRGQPTTLAEAVPRTLLGRTVPMSGDGVTQAIIRAVYGGAPAELGKLAPLVVAQAAAGDRVSCRLTDTAAQRLLAAVEAVRPAVDPTDPVVLAGSVLREGPVAQAVRAGLRERFGVMPLIAEDGALGAAALALRALGGDPTMHRRLLTAAQVCA